jgi:hypothetical protein
MSNQIKRIATGWATLFVIMNISFYSVKYTIDKRRKEEYIKHVSYL